MPNAIDQHWVEAAYRGNPNDIVNPFSGALLLHERGILAITYYNVKDQENTHRRWTKKYKFEPGIYQFNYTTDDGMRIFIDLLDQESRGIVDTVQVIPYTPSNNSWKNQDKTNYIANFELSLNHYQLYGGILQIRVEHYNDGDEWDAVVNEPLLIQAFELPDPPAQQPPPPPLPGEPPAPLPATALGDAVKMSKISVDKIYRKGTLTPIQKETIEFSNTSDILTIAATIDSVNGVAFEPKTFTLLPLEKKNVEVTFDPVQFEKLTEGVTQLVNVVKLSAISIDE